MMYELVVIWSDGTKNIYRYQTKGMAEDAASGIVMAFGNQVEWYGVRKAQPSGVFDYRDALN